MKIIDIDRPYDKMREINEILIGIIPRTDDFIDISTNSVIDGAMSTNYVTQGDIIFGKVMPINNMINSLKIYKDKSELYKCHPDGVVDRVYHGIKDGYETMKERIRTERVHVIDDYDIVHRQKPNDNDSDNEAYRDYAKTLYEYDCKNICTGKKYSECRELMQIVDDDDDSENNNENNNENNDESNSTGASTKFELYGLI